MRSLSLALLLFATTAAAQHRTLEPVPGAPRVGDGQRVALVLGNADYTGERFDLVNPVRDADAMGHALSAIGFTVVVGTDLDQRGMDRAIDEFSLLARDAEIALAFFAGHGVEIDGQNYLIPTDAHFQSRVDVKYDAVEAKKVLERMEEATPGGIRVLILDACRNDPFRDSRATGDDGGLAEMGGKSGSLIAYATRPGSVADDNREGQNGLYTAALLEALQEPGLKIPEVFNAAAGRVTAWSDERQEPWTNQSYVPPVVLTPGDPVTDGGLPLGAYATADLVERAHQSAERGDHATAVHLLRETARRDDPASNVALADLLLEGLGTEADWAGAVRFYRRAAELGNAEGQRKLAWCLARGVGVEPDPAEAVRGYERAIALGDLAAHEGLGLLYAEGAPGVAPDTAAAVRHLRAALDHDAATGEGSFRLARLLYEEADAEALSWLRQSAATGNSEAERWIGRAYEDGHGVEADLAEAARWYRSAVAGGDRDAAFRLGRLYEEGRGVAQDPEEAARLYDRAVWIPEARFALARLYEEGRGVAADPARAFRLYDRTGGGGQAEARAHTRMGAMYEEGRGVAQDLTRAATAYIRGAQLGDTEASRRLDRLDVSDSAP